jgi:hypothetical protein
MRPPVASTYRFCDCRWCTGTRSEGPGSSPCSVPRSSAARPWRGFVGLGRVGLIAVQDVAAVLCSLALDPAGNTPPSQSTPSQTTPGYLVAEVRAVGELFESAAVVGGRRVRQMKLPSFGWRAIRGVLAMLLNLEGRLPARPYNSIWQLTMMCGDGLAAEPSIPEGLALQHRHIDPWLHRQAARRAGQR